MCWAIISNLNHFPANTIGLCSTAVQQQLQGFQWEMWISAMALCAFANQRHLHYLKTISDYCSAVLIPSFCKIKGNLVGFGAHISIPACWCKVFVSVNGDLIGILHNTFLCACVKFCWKAIGQGLVESHPDSLEFLLLSLSTEVLCCHGTGHLLSLQRREMPLGCPSCPGGSAAPSRPCGDISLPGALCQPGRDKAPCCCPLCVSQTRFPFCRECGALQSPAPGGGAAPLPLHQRSQRAPQPVRNMARACFVIPQAGTAVICAGAAVVLVAGLSSAAPAQPSQPRSPGSPSSGKGALRCQGSKATRQPAGTLPEKSEIARHHREQNPRAAHPS